MCGMKWSNVERMIPCNCEECKKVKEPYFHRYSTLEKCLEKNNPAQCAVSTDSTSPIELLEGVFFRHGSGRIGYDVVPNLKQKRKQQVFISYSKEDEELRDKLDKFLAPLKRNDSIETWYDRDLLAGDNWDATIKTKLRAADIVLCLVSADFLATDYIMNVELPLMLKREKEKKAKVIPAILRPCLWEQTELAKFQFLSEKGTPLTLADNEDKALKFMCEQLIGVIEST